MSADEHVSVSVDTTEIEQAIARLDEAISKKEALTGQAISETSTSNVLINQSMLTTQEKTIQSLGKEATEVQQKVEKLVSNEGEEVKAIEKLAKRVSGMIPGLREAARLNQNIQKITQNAGSITSRMGQINTLFAIIAITMTVIQIVQMIKAMQEEQKQKDEAYKREIMEIRGLQTNEEYNNWRQNQKQLMEQNQSWRTGSPSIIG